MFSRDAVVTGIGAITPLGATATETWHGMVRGATGARTLTADWADHLPVRLAAPVTADPTRGLSYVQARRLDRVVQFAVTAATEAWADAGLANRPDVDPDRVAVVVSSVAGGLGALLSAHDTLRIRGARHVPPYTLAAFIPNAAAAQIAIEVRARGSVHAPSNGCASGTESIAQAADLVRLGRADVVLAGGAEAPIHPVILGGFAAMRALSTRNDDPAHACRPFDTARDGFVLGEGAGILVVEEAGHARARGAPVLARILGSGTSTDAHHMVRPRPDGAAMAAAARRSLADAGVAPHHIAHVNAHATATAVGDLAESRALHQVFGTRVDQVLVSATKAMTGHLQGAAGAVETIATLLALREHRAPPTLNRTHPDPAIALTLTGDTATPLPAGPLTGMCVSAGFGGSNTCLVLATP